VLILKPHTLVPNAQMMDGERLPGSIDTVNGSTLIIIFESARLARHSHKSNG
jgi:hypothetical protein